MPYVNYNQDMNTYMKRRYYERRSMAFEILGNCCTYCGSIEQLEIDHIDPFKKQMRINKLWSCSLVKLIDELTRCQLLCHSCHKKKSSGPDGDIARKLRASKSMAD